MQRTGNALSLLLMLAAVPTKLRCVVWRLLLPHLLVCRCGETALIGAASKGHESIVGLLLEYLADVNVANK